jgi:hypothetical protein
MRVAHGKVAEGRDYEMWHRSAREVVHALVHRVIERMGGEHVHCFPEVTTLPAFGPKSSGRTRVFGGPWTALTWEVQYKRFCRLGAQYAEEVLCLSKEEAARVPIHMFPLLVFFDKAASGLYPAIITSSALSLAALDSGMGKALLGLLPVPKLKKWETKHENGKLRGIEFQHECVELLLGDAWKNEDTPIVGELYFL